MAKKLHIKTFGCQMNVYDSDRMADVLTPLGYVATAVPDDADMVILNTCHIREKAAEKLFSELGRLRNIKERRLEDGIATVIAVAGCVAQAEGAEIIKRAPYVDIVLGPQTYHRLPEMVARASRAAAGQQETKGILDIEFPDEPKFDHLPEVTAKGFSAFLSVQEGCDKFCTFCVVPYTRGAEFSRPFDDVINEARTVAAGGVKEITLLGQNVNAYHGETIKGKSGSEAGLGELIRQLAEIEGISRLRYTTSHPIDMADDLIAAHGNVATLMPFLHLPIQSGSDRILSRMNRHHRIDDYRRVVDKLLAVRPDMKLSSDFIVGFPGESDEDFEATMNLAREFQFVQAYSFKYSPRPGTPGAVMQDQIPEALQSERLAALQEILEQNQINFNQQCVDSVVPVLFDRQGRKEGQLVGRTPYMQPVHVQAPQEMFGQIAEVKLTSAHANSLGGELILAAHQSSPMSEIEKVSA
ncbi:MAG: tRNA (N6-isopentenyl adenosine(37)-C2)-methylthiotransferase MiaB [Rhodospirillaceae bacterium]|nr:tRNA (N6-isopentenyl adenosine(37)-C2)-methylthiotransferase MiaB [Rhodospirillaceae bacterium]